MFEHLVRDGTILFLAGVTILTKVVPSLRLKNYVESVIATTLGIGWLLSVAGFACMIAGVMTNSW